MTLRSATALSIGAALLVLSTTQLSAATGTSGANSVIRLLGSSATATGRGVKVNGRRIIINAAGTYTISGKLDDGEIVVDTTDRELVRLVLANATISSSAGAPIAINTAEQVEISLPEGSVNRVADTPRRAVGRITDDGPRAAIDSNEDLTIRGSGSLTIDGRNRHGIVSSDSITIRGGKLTINASGDGIRGKDALVVHDGTIVVTAGGDGLQAYGEDAEDQGQLSINGGTVRITAVLDAIQAAGPVAVNGGVVVAVAGGGSTARGGGSNPSAKGINAARNIHIGKGTLTIDAADDALNSNQSIIIDGGTLRLASGNDGVHADKSLQINGGNLQITRSYEGLESAAIGIHGGQVRLVSTDDGVNVVDTGEDTGFSSWRGERGSSANGHLLTISGGYLYVDSGGDGLDCSGAVEMSGGRVVVNGPTVRSNGALDIDGGFKLSGGLLIAVGSAGMAQAPGSASTQPSISVGLAGVLPAGTPVHLAAGDGKPLLTFVPTKAYQSVVLSSPDLKQGATYVIYTGGQPTGSTADGLSFGPHKAGTELARITLSGIVTRAGSRR